MLTLIVPVMMSVERPLRRQQRGESDRPRLLRQADDRVLDLGRRDHHQIRELVDHAEDVWERRLAVALADPVELAEVARAGHLHDLVAALHLGDQVVEDVGRQTRRGDDRRQQMRDLLVVVELDPLRVDQHHPHLVRRGVEQDRAEDRVDAASFRSPSCQRSGRAASSVGRSDGAAEMSLPSQATRGEPPCGQPP
jgi:hypothetical protein